MCGIQYVSPKIELQNLLTVGISTYNNVVHPQ